MSLLDGLEVAQDVLDRGVSFRSIGGPAVRLTYAQLRDQVARAATVLTEAGVLPGTTVAVLVPTPQDLVALVLAVQWCGGTPCVLPPPGVTRPSVYAQATEHALTVSGAGLVVVANDLVPLVAELPSTAGSADVLTADEALVRWSPAAPRTPVPGSALALVQLTSGSTGAARAVGVSVRALDACHDATRAAYGVRPDDTAVTWLPLHHDMGLVGTFLSAVTDLVELVVMSPVDMLRDPLSWLDEIDTRRATITASPLFGAALLAKRLRALEQPRDWDLSCLRTWIFGAEPLRADVLRELVTLLAPYGLPPDALVPSYGCAEATLTMTASPHRPLLTDPVSREALGRGLAVPARPGDDVLEVVACGPAVPGAELRVVDGDGQPVPDRTVGEVAFRSPAVVSGYLGEDDPRTFPGDGWLQPGDLGYLVDGELYLTGRSKDLLILNGRNHDPSSVEWAVERVEGARPGCVAAFTVPGPDTERLVLAVEVRAGAVGVGQRVRAAVTSELRLPVHDVLELAPGELPKTTSGKVRRSGARALYLSAASET